MKSLNLKKHGRPLAHVALALPLAALVACGGGESVSSTSVLQGTVYSGGAAVAGAEVVVMNRLTDQEHNYTTDKYGQFSLELPNGHYDYGATDGARHDATIHGLVTLGGAEAKADIHLPPDSAADDVISGTIYTTGQTPAAGYRLVLSSNHDGADLRMNATTNDQGQFEFSGIEGQLLFDLDIFDPDGQEVEFIDLHKLDGALHTTITLGDATDNNVHRHHQSPADDSVVAEGDAAIKVAAVGDNQAFDVENAVDDLRADYPGGDLIRQTIYADDDVIEQYPIANCWKAQGGDRYCKNRLINGKLAFDGGKMTINYIDKRNFDNQKRNTGFNFDFNDESQIQDTPGVAQAWVELEKSGNWFYRYAVSLKDRGKIYISKNSPGNPTCQFYFTDETNDTYALKIRNTVSSFTDHYHTVSYNSDRPDITAIESTCKW
jgi:hypothetical protein